MKPECVRVPLSLGPLPIRVQSLDYMTRYYGLLAWPRKIQHVIQGDQDHGLLLNILRVTVAG